MLFNVNKVKPKLFYFHSKAVQCGGCPILCKCVNAGVLYCKTLATCQVTILIRFKILYNLSTDCTSFAQHFICNSSYFSFNTLPFTLVLGNESMWLTLCAPQRRTPFSIPLFFYKATNSRMPVDSILEAVVTVSPNKQYRGMVRPTTPATHGPENQWQIL